VGPTDSLGVEALRRTHFAFADLLRRTQGDLLGVCGLNPREAPRRIVAKGRHWRLRDYAEHDSLPRLLIVAAPIKRPYIWDLAPPVSAIRHCLAHGHHVYLLEWMPASGHTENNGLDDYVQAIGECVAKISDDVTGAKPDVMGHSLGGTLAAIYAAAAPDSLRSLVLLSAPLCFAPKTCRFRDALVSMVPNELSEADPFPGALLSQMSALASPEAFVWSRYMDAVFSAADPQAFDIHARVERWALDEVPLPGRLVRQILEWLYRENRFCRGTLQIADKSVGPSGLSVPTLVVVNTADDVAPLASMKPFLEAMPQAQLIQHAGEVGVGLQHLAILVGREARAQVWPQIISWLNARN
jgi:polyhydroxyalkanoate synthase